MLKFFSAQWCDNLGSSKCDRLTLFSHYSQQEINELKPRMIFLLQQCLKNCALTFSVSQLAGPAWLHVLSHFLPLALTLGWRLWVNPPHVSGRQLQVLIWTSPFQYPAEQDVLGLETQSQKHQKKDRQSCLVFLVVFWTQRCNKYPDILFCVHDVISCCLHQILGHVQSHCRFVVCFPQNPCQFLSKIKVYNVNTRVKSTILMALRILFFWN